MTMHIGQPELPLMITEGQPLMIDAQELEDGRIEIMPVNRVLYDPIAKFISLTIELPRMQER